MKKFLLIFIFLISNLFAQTPLSLDEVKAIIFQNADALSQYQQGSVFRIISRKSQQTPDGKICEFETTRIDTVLLAPEQDDSFFEIYLLMESSAKPITVDTCGDLIKTDSEKMIFLMAPPVPSLKWFANFNLEDEKYFQTDDGLIYSERESDKWYHDFKMPLFYSEIRWEDKSTGANQIITKMPDANLEIIYSGIKELPVAIMYPSGPNDASLMELPKKFGEILEEWRAWENNR
jgi:hypothetical protein